MALEMQFVRTCKFAGQTLSETTTLSAGDGRMKAVETSLAQPGALTTRTSDTTGTLTMTNADHGITTGSRLDLFWEDPDGTRGHRRGITVGTVAGLAVPLTNSGEGDVLPADETIITACVPTEVVLDVEGDDVLGMTVQCGREGCVVITDGSDVELFALNLGNSGVYHWPGKDSDQPTNPLEGVTAAKLFASSADTAIASTARVGLLIDDTP